MVTQCRAPPAVHAERSGEVVTVTGPVAPTGRPHLRRAHGSYRGRRWGSSGSITCRWRRHRGARGDARRFYELLGMPELTKLPVLAARAGAGSRPAPRELHVGVERDFRPARRPTLALGVRRRPRGDRRASHRRRRRRGGDDANPGVTRFHVHDPLGQPSRARRAPRRRSPERRPSLRGGTRGIAAGRRRLSTSIDQRTGGLLG